MSRPSWQARVSASVSSLEALRRLCRFCGDYKPARGSTLVGRARLFCCAECKDLRAARKAG